MANSSRGLLPGLLGVFCFLLLAGCVSHHGSVGWLNQSDPPPGKYRVIRPVHGEASTTSFLGLRDGVPPKALYDRARENLMSSVELGDGRAIVHRTMDEVDSSFPPKLDSNFLDPLFSLARIYHKKTVRFSGDLVEVRKASN